MTEIARIERNRDRLQECDGIFRHALARMLADLQAQGFRPRIQDAWRSPADEERAYVTGHSEVRRGFHSVTNPDGSPAALAADVLDDDRPLAPSRAYVLALTRTARAHGLQTGILWGLPAITRGQLDAALAAGTDWTGPVGWDVLHVEIAGLTIAEALAGKQPMPAGDPM